MLSLAGCILKQSFFNAVKIEIKLQRPYKPWVRTAQ